MAGEHVFDSWEDFEESGELDRQLNHFTSGSSSSDRKSNSSPRLMKEDSHRTAYQPQLRILKRPSSSSATTAASAGCVEFLVPSYYSTPNSLINTNTTPNANPTATPDKHPNPLQKHPAQITYKSCQSSPHPIHDPLVLVVIGSHRDKPVQPRNIKTLEEREAAYAEARLRILGPDATSTSDQTKQSTKNSSQGSQKISGCDSSVSGLEASMGRLRTQSDGVLRQPKGPDGSSGFRQHDSSEPT